MTINRDGPIAPWRQLAELIRARIASGELPAGARLPSITGMAQEYGLAVTTVQKTIQALKDDGSIVTSPMGTFVSDRQA